MHLSLKLMRTLLNGCLLLLCLAVGLRADTLRLTNGDRLTGTVKRADNAKVVFHSDPVGDVTVEWKDVQQLQTAGTYVIVEPDRTVVRGSVAFGAGALTVGGASVTLDRVRLIVSAADYDKAMREQGLLQGWRGELGAAFSEVSATQSSTSLSTDINLHRTVPPFEGVPQRSNTLFEFHAAYGSLTQPGVARVKTSIFSLGLEQDENFTAHAFALEDAAFSHNYSQGLQFQQEYGGGGGWILVDSKVTHLELKADVHWTREEFLAGPSTSFVASNVSETMHRQLGRIAWTENITAAPAYTNWNAFQASAATAWAMPVARALAVNIALLDSYLNNPQPGFQHNSFQFSTGVVWSVK